MNLSEKVTAPPATLALDAMTEKNLFGTLRGALDAVAILRGNAARMLGRSRPAADAALLLAALRRDAEHWLDGLGPAERGAADQVLAAIAAGAAREHASLAAEARLRESERRAAERREAEAAEARRREAEDRRFADRAAEDVAYHTWLARRGAKPAPGTPTRRPPAA